MAVLINGNGNKAIYANQDADLIASLVGDQSCISAVGSQMAATAQDANTIAIADGVCITKEGRRIQLDNGRTDIFEIPTGESGVTNYYIIGYHLYTEADSSQKCETFVQKMANSTATITEDTFRGGATDVYVSLYRVTQVGFNITTIDALLVSLANLEGLKSDLKDLEGDSFTIITESNDTYATMLAKISNHSRYDTSKLRAGSFIKLDNRIYYYNAYQGFVSHTFYGTAQYNVYELSVLNKTYANLKIENNTSTFINGSSTACSNKTVIVHY